ncbi:MAG: hypothetical protein N2322_05875 [Terrimicrobiaceae bacterium]|nr:hypothetical protein [Terrimicrobiaceae bacterium]
MRVLLPLLALPLLASCTTLENRRDLYSPQRVDGPYTRMLREGIPQREPVSGQAPPASSFKNVVR